MAGTWRRLVEAVQRYRRRRAVRTDVVACVVGDGNGNVWVAGGPPTSDLMWVRLGTASGEVNVARNLSQHQFAYGETVLCRWMQTGAGANMLVVIWRERRRCPTFRTVYWTGGDPLLNDLDNAVGTPLTQWNLTGFTEVWPHPTIRGHFYTINLFDSHSRVIRVEPSGIAYVDDTVTGGFGSPTYFGDISKDSGEIYFANAGFFTSISVHNTVTHITSTVSLDFSQVGSVGHFRNIRLHPITGALYFSDECRIYRIDPPLVGTKVVQVALDYGVFGPFVFGASMSCNEASTGDIFRIDFDAAGRLYFRTNSQEVLTNGVQIRVWDGSSAVTIAGGGAAAFTEGALAISVKLDDMVEGIAVDQCGNVYLSCPGLIDPSTIGRRVLRRDAVTGALTTVAFFGKQTQRSILTQEQVATANHYGINSLRIDAWGDMYMCGGQFKRFGA